MKVLDRSSEIPPTRNWGGSAWQSESTFHQLSPYIGKTKSSMAAALVEEFSRPGDVLYEPFSGCGTIAFEAWKARRNVIANDLSPYGHLLTRAKLFPYHSLHDALKDFKDVDERAKRTVSSYDLRRAPRWVRQFFHPETLREVLAWTAILRAEEKWFLLACLMGILHHQRPGFLSYPSSHTVPYLRVKKFPPHRFPKLYEYRSLSGRLDAKIHRAFRRVPNLDYGVRRKCLMEDASDVRSSSRVDVLLTSPPYMRQLDYGRDNRLRLWFLGCDNWEELDTELSPRESGFLKLMRRCFEGWKSLLKPNASCVLIIGDNCSREEKENLPRDIARIATSEVGGYSIVDEFTDLIPNVRRVRRGLTGNISETILVLRRAAK